MSRTVVITGGSGFIGRALVRHVASVAPGLRIVLIDQAEPSQDRHVEWMPADITDVGAVRRVFEQVRPTDVFHLASAVRAKDAATLLHVNSLGTAHVVEAATSLGGDRPPRFILASSAAVYGASSGENPIRESEPLRPVTHYGVSKAAAELSALREGYVNGLPVVIARPFNVLGPGQPEGFVCTDLARRVVEVESGGGADRVLAMRLDTSRDFVDVRDVAAALWTLAEEGEAGEAYNVCSGSCHSIQEVLDVLRALSIADFDVECSEGAAPTRLDVKQQTGDNRKIVSDTAWRPAYSFEQSLEDVLEEVRASCC